MQGERDGGTVTSFSVQYGISINHLMWYTESLHDTKKVNGEFRILKGS